MEIWQVIVLALVQGLTEFLPISSSAHLILLPYFADWPDQGLTFDVAVHVGTLLAVVLYFRRELSKMFLDWLRSMQTGHAVGESKMVWLIVAATVPAGLAGLFLELLVPGGLRSPLLIAGTTVGFGLLLWWADAAGGHLRHERGIGMNDAILIGLAQALALIPGTSRSGVTITAGRALGLSRRAAARFSFLLSIPVIALAGGAKLYAALGAGEATQWGALLLGTLIAFSSAYTCIHYFLKLIAHISLLPFVIYRLALGGVILIVAL
ncbi:MAG TPA: undecaprenyl-diphosphate phosphatase [Gammaproteobacteria bacterium]|nr:undecaprenyl-diphosphate phosphatase [Gammaproteobacteria bacterium]